MKKREARPFQNPLPKRYWAMMTPHYKYPEWAFNPRGVDNWLSPGSDTKKGTSYRYHIKPERRG